MPYFGFKKQKDHIETVGVSKIIKANKCGEAGEWGQSLKEKILAILIKSIILLAVCSSLLLKVKL